MKSPRITIWLAVLILVTASCNQSAETPDFEAAIDSLKEGASYDEVKAALAILESAGDKAFPSLLGRLGDQSPAASNFQRALVTADGQLYPPKIGDVCFDIFHAQVEGSWPRLVREFYVLNQSNVMEWWESNKTKSLVELKRQCSAESLRRAREEFKTRDDEFAHRYGEKIVEFLESNFEGIDAN